MKVLNCFLLFFCFSVLLVSCKKDDDQQAPEPVNVIEKDYFTLINGVYNDGDIPKGTADILDEAYISSYIIKGGSAIITFNSTQKLKGVHVAIKGNKGYYYLAVTTTSSSAPFEYEVVLNINQTIVHTEMAISISAITEGGQVTTILSSEPIEVIEAGTGSTGLQISLAWDQLDDVDLHVYDPDGNHIWYGDRVVTDNKRSFNFKYYSYLVRLYSSRNIDNLKETSEDDFDTLLDYLEEIEDQVKNQDFTNFMKKEAENYKLGYIDLDSNAACTLDEVNNENVIFSTPKNGKYTIKVDLYSKCQSGTSGAKYAVTLNYKGVPVQFSTTQRGEFNANYYGSADVDDYESKYVTIGTFTVTDTRSASTKSGVASPVNTKEVIQKVSNRRQVNKVNDPTTDKAAKFLFGKGR